MPISNAGDAPVDRWFDGSDPAGFYSTGAGGSSQAPDQPVFGERLATVPTASNPYESSQGPRVMADVDVGQSNLPGQYPQSFPLVGAPLGGAGEQTSAGQATAGPHGTGHVYDGPPHPNAAGVPHASPARAPGGRGTAYVAGPGV